MQDYRHWPCKTNKLCKIHVNWSWQRWRLSKTKHFSQKKLPFTLLFVLVLAAKEQKQSYEFFSYICHNFTVNMWCELQFYCHWVSFRQGMTSLLSCGTYHISTPWLWWVSNWLKEWTLKLEGSCAGVLYMKLLVIFHEYTDKNRK